MPIPNEDEVLRLMREARAKDRGYASFFGWATNRDLEELGPVQELANAALADGKLLFKQVQIRGRGKDPPDLEAVTQHGQRVAIEVTELVDSGAIKAYKAGRVYDWAEWDRTKFLRELQRLVDAKAKRKDKLLGGPYPGGYVIVVFTDEPLLTVEAVRSFLTGQNFVDLTQGIQAYLLLSYSPATENYPYFALHREA